MLIGDLKLGMVVEFDIRDVPHYGSVVGYQSVTQKGKTTLRVQVDTGIGVQLLLPEEITPVPVNK